MKKPVCPCNHKCEGRTATCKFDGTCDKWAEYAPVAEKYRLVVRTAREKSAFPNAADNRNKKNHRRI